MANEYRNTNRDVVPISSGVLMLIVGIGLALLEQYILQASAWIGTIGFVLVGLGLAIIAITTLMTYFSDDA